MRWLVARFSHDDLHVNTDRWGGYEPEGDPPVVFAWCCLLAAAGLLVLALYLYGVGGSPWQ